VLVLCHGAHLGARNWRELAIGDLAHDRAGRAPRALEFAILHDASFVLWATGASEQDGLKESVYTFETAKKYAAEILGYLQRRSVVDSDFSVEMLLEFMERTALFDSLSQNTVEEVANAAEVAKIHDCAVVIQVSSGTHIQRCYATAVAWMVKNPGKVRFVPVHADTCFPDSSPADVVVLEPPHRGDNLPLGLQRLVRPLFRLMGMTGSPEFVVRVIRDVASAMSQHNLHVNPYDVLPLAPESDVGSSINGRLVIEAGPVVPFALDGYLRGLRFGNGECAIFSSSNGIWEPNTVEAARVVKSSTQLPQVDLGIESDVVWVMVANAEGGFRVKLFFNEKAAYLSDELERIPSSA